MSELEESALFDSFDDSETSILEQDMEGNEFFKKCDKYNSGWLSSHMFNGYGVRAIFKRDEHICFLERENTLLRFKRKLERDIGEEKEDWDIVENPLTGKDELYLKDSIVISQWFFRDPKRITELFDEVFEAE